MKRLPLLLSEINYSAVQALVREVRNGSMHPQVVGVRCEERLAGLPSHFMELDARDVKELAALVRPHF